MEAVKTLASIDDHLERLVVSFKDAKIALLEWSEPIDDLQTVSIHTYERAPQLVRVFLRIDMLRANATIVIL